MRKEIEKIIKENFDVWYNRATNSIELNSTFLTEKLEDYFKNDGLEELVKNIHPSEIRDKAKKSFEDEDIDGLKEEVSGQDLEFAIYYNGYFQGYVDSYQDATGMDFPL